MSTKEFNYTREWTDAEAFPLLSFTKNWENPDDYPTIETDEQKVRQDMQSLHDEVKDFLNNELIPRVVLEDATVDAWTASEDTRVANEAERVAQEQARASAEQARVEVEASRVTTESARVNAESARATAEQGRASAEDIRVASEAGRVSAEASRVTAESARATVEASRVTAESGRVDAENTRMANENTRISTEQGRKDAEAVRVANENQRIENNNTLVQTTKDAREAIDSVENLDADWVELPAGSPVYVEKSVNAEGGIQLTFGLSRGTSGVYVGSGTMPDDANIQIDPTGDPTDTAGLMMTKTYDPTGKAQDIFAYALPANSKGNPDGVASLNGEGKVPVEQLPEISSVKTFEATIGTSWTENEETGVKTQTVAIAGITAENTAKVDHSSASVDGTSDGYATFVEEENQYLTYITNGFAETVAGGIKFTIFGDAPTVSIPIVVEVV